MFTKHDSRNSFPWHHGIITNPVKLIRREEVEMLLPWWTTSIWSALLRYPYDITSEGAVSRTNFSALLLPNFMKFTFLGFYVVVLLKTFLIDVSITNVGLILTKIRRFQLFSTSQNSSQNSISNFFESNSNFWVTMM